MAYHLTGTGNTNIYIHHARLFKKESGMTTMEFLKQRKNNSLQRSV